MCAITNIKVTFLVGLFKVNSLEVFVVDQIEMNCDVTWNKNVHDSVKKITFKKLDQNVTEIDWETDRRKKEKKKVNVFIWKSMNQQ